MEPGGQIVVTTSRDAALTPPGPDPSVPRMSLQLVPFREDDRAVLQALVCGPALADEFDVFTDADYLDHKLADPYRDRDCTLIAREDGEPAGFCIAFRIPRPEGGAWAALRIGVVERFQRNHIATALLAAARRELEGRAIPGGLHEIVMSAWRPNPAAAAFATGHGFHHVRWSGEVRLASAKSHKASGRQLASLYAGETVEASPRPPNSQRLPLASIQLAALSRAPGTLAAAGVPLVP